MLEEYILRKQDRFDSLAKPVANDMTSSATVTICFDG
jgi:hypothetical protein